MPRLEIIADNINDDDTTETVDLCSNCASNYTEGDVWKDGYTVGYDDELHPDYEDWDGYTCELCNKKLTRKDD